LDQIPPRDDNEEVELINAAITLFNEVDLNSDGTMEWGEFV
jgi:hypothetical protein